MVGQLLLGELVPLIDAHQGVIYQIDAEEVPILKILASYADAQDHPYPPLLRVGEGFIGQCARAKRRLLISTFRLTRCPGLGLLPGASA